MGFIVDRIEIEVPIKRAPQFGLRGEQAKSRIVVFSKDELRERRTKSAFAVENSDGMIVIKARDVRIGSIFVRRALHGVSRRPKKRAKRGFAKGARSR